MGRKRKSYEETMESKPENPFIAVPELKKDALHEMLAYAGMDRVMVIRLLADLGIHDAETAYRFLRSQDRIPEMGIEEFTHRYEELMQS